MENKENQEIDLGAVFQQSKNFLKSILVSFFTSIQYVKNNILKIGILFLIGAVLGYFLDKNSISYQQEIIVTPNLESVDYLYKRIDLLNALIKEKDTNFLYKKGFRGVKKINTIKIEPIVDVFKFVETYQENNSNFDLIKLMAEDGDLNKIIKDEVTSKNYTFHEISFATSKKIKEENILIPIINFLNESKFYQENLRQEKENTLNKISQNDTIIKQIDLVLESFKTNSGSNKNASLVYYNENTQLNDLIKTKNSTIGENNQLKLELIKLDKIIKDVSYTLNIKDQTGLNGKMLFIMPILFVLLYFGFLQFKNAYIKYTK